MTLVPKRSKILHPHVETRPGICGGEPVVRGTRFPVRSIVEYVLRAGMTPEEVVAEWKQLTLAQVHDALSYYYDHKAEVDRSIRANRRAARPRKVSS